MSGGSWDYLYGRVDEAGKELQRSTDPLRRAFGAHLVKVAEALHDVEWVDSCDYGPGDERAAIETVLGENAKALELQEVLSELKGTMKKAEDLLSNEQATTPIS